MGLQTVNNNDSQEEINYVYTGNGNNNSYVNPYANSELLPAYISGKFNELTAKKPLKATTYSYGNVANQNNNTGGIDLSSIKNELVNGSFDVTTLINQLGTQGGSVAGIDLSTIQSQLQSGGLEINSFLSQLGVPAGAVPNVDLQSLGNSLGIDLSNLAMSNIGNFAGVDFTGLASNIAGGNLDFTSLAKSYGFQYVDAANDVLNIIGSISSGSGVDAGQVVNLGIDSACTYFGVPQLAPQIKQITSYAGEFASVFNASGVSSDFFVKYPWAAFLDNSTQHWKSRRPSLVRMNAIERLAWYMQPLTDGSFDYNDAFQYKNFCGPGNDPDKIANDEPNLTYKLAQSYNDVLDLKVFKGADYFDFTDGNGYRVVNKKDLHIDLTKTSDYFSGGYAQRDAVEAFKKYAFGQAMVTNLIAKGYKQNDLLARPAALNKEMLDFFVKTKNVKPTNYGARNFTDNIFELTESFGYTFPSYVEYGKFKEDKNSGDSYGNFEYTKLESYVRSAVNNRATIKSDLPDLYDNLGKQWITKYIRLVSLSLPVATVSLKANNIVNTSQIPFPNTQTAAPTKSNNWLIYILIAIVLLFMVYMMFKNKN